jgi:polygalacturonase
MPAIPAAAPAAALLMLLAAAPAQPDATPSAAASPSGVICRPEDYGARRDGQTLDTAALQQALDACAKKGTALLSGGTYLSGPLRLHSGETLRIDKGAVLKASDDPALYEVEGKPNKAQAFILADGVHDLALTGGGTIDGSGARWWARYRAEKAADPKAKGSPRPRLVVLRDVHGARIEGLTLTNAPMFNLVTDGSETITVDGVSILNPADSPNTDGIDPINSRHIAIRNVLIDTGDDHIAIKADKRAKDGAPATSDITITDSLFRHGHGVSIGSDTQGGVKGVTVERIAIDGADNGLRIKTRRGRGGEVSDVTYRDVKLTHVLHAIRITSYYQEDADADQGQPLGPETPDLHDIRFENITGDGNPSLGEVRGLPERPVRGVTFTNVTLGGQTGLTVGHAEIAVTGGRLSSDDGQPLAQRDGARVKGAR